MHQIMPRGSGCIQLTYPPGCRSRRDRGASHPLTRRKQSVGGDQKGLGISYFRNPIGSTLLTYHRRHELQSRHPQLHGHQQARLALIDGVQGVYGFVHLLESFKSLRGGSGVGGSRYFHQAVRLAYLYPARCDSGLERTATFEGDVFGRRIWMLLSP